MESGNEGSPSPPEPQFRFGGFKRWLEKRGFARSSRPTEPVASPPPAPSIDSGVQTAASTPTPPPAESRTFRGILPEGSTIQRLRADTKTHIEYGEKTWTTGQTVRDVLQNHLDANTQQFFDRLVSTVVDVDRLAERSARTGDGFDEFSYNLFLFRKGLGSFSPDSEKEMVDMLNRHAYSVPIRKEFLDEQGKLRLDALKEAVTPIVEIPPRVSYKVVDLSNPESQNKDIWLSYDELQQSKFSIVGIKIEDQGGGFDAKLSAFYKSTKRGQRHLRGKFGEGAKMSETHLMRHNAQVKMRSRYEINGGRPAHERVWQHRAYLGADNTVQQKGIQVDLPPGQQSNVGSFTLITIDKADPAFQREFRANVDPRIRGGGLAQNCLEYSKARYYYPMAEFGYNAKPVGVSLEVSPANQYVQGLRVGGDSTSRQDVIPLFSYDFLDSSILQGRDRSDLNRSIKDQIYNLWTHADSSLLVSELIRRLAKTDYLEYSAPEANVLNRILYGDYDSTEIKTNTQKGRTTEIALRVFPSLIDAKPGTKNVIVKANDAYRDKDFIAILQARGYNIISLRAGIGDKAISNLNKAHEGNYQFYSIATVQTEVQATRKEMDPNDERVRLSQEVFHSAFSEMRSIAEKAGFNLGDFSLESNPQFEEVIDPTKEIPFNLKFDENTKKFRLIIRPALLTKAMYKEGGRDYWKRRIQVELLATYKRNEKFPDVNTQYIASQNTAQQFLNKTLHTGLADVDALPSEFNYQPQVVDALEAIKRFSTEQANIQEALIGWDMFRSVTTFQTSLEQMEKVSQGFSHIPEPYRQKVKDIMGNRVVLENGVVGYFDYPEEGSGDLTLIRKQLDTLTPEGSIDGKPVYKLGDKLFMPYELPKGSVIKMETAYDNHTLVMYSDQLLDFAGDSFGPYQFRTHPIIIESGGFTVKIDRFRPYIDSSIRSLEAGLKNLAITSPERKSGEGMRFLEGVVETPFPSEYGIDEWDNPARVFQDILQNHLDASPTGKIDAHYEVHRGQQRVWVTEQEVAASDIIVGFSVSDNGEGYTPNDLGTVGMSSKKSPLFAGKYGEGQKMIAAAAVRNGFELRFSSVANYDGARYRWQGTVGTRPEEIVINGKPTNVDRVVFNVASNQTNGSEGYASSTVIRLPEDASQSTKVWQEWLQVIDPRVKDKFGDGGLARYVLPMRSSNGEKIIDMGYMKILVDRPGEVYENGLLVSTEGGTALGYDVPEVVTTRERNRFDYSRLSQYIANAAYSCPNPDYAMALMQKFKEKYLTEVVGNPKGAYIREQDIAFGHMHSDHYDDFVPARPYWRQAYNTQLGTYLVYSEQALRNRIKWGTDELTASYTREERKEGIIKEIEQAYSALANVVHVPSDHIIHAQSNDEYAYWSRLFPTVEEYIKNLSEQEVPVTDDIRKSLETVVSASNGVLSSTHNTLRSTGAGQRVYESIVTGKTPSESDQDALIKADATVAEQFSYWTPEELQQHPGRVFVAPANAGYLGLATRDRIGFNELLLASDDLRKIAGTARHELLHKIYGLRDYSPEFIMMLLESAKSNLQ